MPGELAHVDHRLAAHRHPLRVHLEDVGQINANLLAAILIRLDAEADGEPGRARGDHQLSTAGLIPGAHLLLHLAHPCIVQMRRRQEGSGVQVADARVLVMRKGERNHGQGEEPAAMLDAEIDEPRVDWSAL